MKLYQDGGGSGKQCRRQHLKGAEREPGSLRRGSHCTGDSELPAGYKGKPSHQKQNAKLKARASSALQLFKFHPYYHVNFTEVHKHMKRLD